MIKIIWLLRRKPGISFEAFQEHYERSHAELGKTYFGHLIRQYRRNYNDRRILETTHHIVARLMEVKACDYDCITEWELDDEAAMAEVVRLLSDPVISKVFYDDEEHFLDRTSVRYLRCDTRDTGVIALGGPVLVEPACNA
jgi:hypothetical protein